MTKMMKAAANFHINDIGDVIICTRAYVYEHQGLQVSPEVPFQLLQIIAGLQKAQTKTTC